MKRGKTIFLFLFFSALQALAAPDFVLRQMQDEASLDGKFWLYTDKSKNIDFEGARRLYAEKKFQHYKGGIFQMGYTADNHWAATTFRYDGFDKREFYFVVPTPMVYRLNFYLTNEKDSLLRYTVTGSQYPFAHREGGNRYFIFAFTPEPGQTYHFYSLFHDAQGNLKVPFKLMTKDAYERFFELETFMLSCFFGLLALAFCVCMALFINFKDKIYVFYGMYVLSILLLRFTHFGFSYKYLFPDYPPMAAISKALFWITTAIGLINFAPRLIAPTLEAFPRTVLLFKWQTALYISFLPIGFLFYDNLRVSTFAVYFMNINFFATLLGIFYLIVKNIQVQYKPALYFTIAFVPITLLSIYIMLTNVNLLPYFGVFNRYFIEIGSTFEIIMLFGALVYRFKTTMDERFMLEYKLMEAEFLKKQAPAVASNEEKYKNSKFSGDEVLQKHKELLDFMARQKPYLDQEMNLPGLSQITGINPHLISQVINQVENKNFFDFLNSYRIEEAKKMLRDSRFDNHSVEGVGYECGFNTKATFYNTFKKFTGLTPAEFKKRG